MRQEIGVAIPCRAGDSAAPAIETLSRQTRPVDVVVIQPDHGLGANWARNVAFERLDTALVLFSDADIEWDHDAVEVLERTLDQHPAAAYAYGAYEMGGLTNCAGAFSAEALRAGSCISTMALVRRHLFCGFDESLRRLQDWDAWLTMLERGHVGVYCGRVVFKTKIRKGISFGGEIDWADAEAIVRRKHGLPGATGK